MAQWLRALTVLPKVWVQFPATTWWLTTIGNGIFLLCLKTETMYSHKINNSKKKEKFSFLFLERIWIGNKQWDDSRDVHFYGEVPHSKELSSFGTTFFTKLSPKSYLYHCRFVKSIIVAGLLLFEEYLIMSSGVVATSLHSTDILRIFLNFINYEDLTSWLMVT